MISDQVKNCTCSSYIHVIIIIIIIIALQCQQIKTINEIDGTVIHEIDIEGHRPLWLMPSESK